ncbi:MAG: hypothetical protein U1G07_09340 [Verrucomicrobiota bacterium]
MKPANWSEVSARWKRGALRRRFREPFDDGANYLLNGPGHGDDGRIVFRKPKEVREILAALGIVAPTISAHCAAFAHLSAKWGSEYSEKFVPPAVQAKGAGYVESWSEDYLIGLLETGTGAGIQIYGWFWGLWGNPVLHSGCAGRWLGKDDGGRVGTLSHGDGQSASSS